MKNEERKMKNNGFMKQWHIIGLIGCLLLAGCGQDNLYTMEEGKEVNVSLSLNTLPPEGTDTRAMAPHIPEVENLIHDIWVLQFNNRGVLLNTETKYYPREGEGNLVVEDFEAGLIAAQGSTVCLVVNTGNADLVWPNNLPDFQQMLLDIRASNDLSERDRMPMCGYWMGDVTGAQTLSVMLSRMMTRINLVVNNETEEELTDLTVTLSKVPTQAYVYPSINQAALPADAYTKAKFSDTFTGTIAAGASQQFYYYMAPNICTDEAMATKATITSGDKTWSVTLGTDSPNTADRDYALYANNYYTFTLNLK